LDETATADVSQSRLGWSSEFGPSIEIIVSGSDGALVALVSSKDLDRGEQLEVSVEGCGFGPTSVSSASDVYYESPLRSQTRFVSRSPSRSVSSSGSSSRALDRTSSRTLSLLFDRSDLIGGSALLTTTGDIPQSESMRASTIGSRSLLIVLPKDLADPSSVDASNEPTESEYIEIYAIFPSSEGLNSNVIGTRTTSIRRGRPHVFGESGIFVRGVPAVALDSNAGWFDAVSQTVGGSSPGMAASDVSLCRSSISCDK
jgi:hypothetical protein